MSDVAGLADGLSECSRREPSPNGGYRIPDEIYNRRWIERARRRSIVSETGCWLWQGWKNVWGYAQMAYRGRQVSVHRQLHKLVHKIELTREQYVCHTCDVRHCVNPDHTWIGSNSENQIDSSIKMRHYESRRRCCERGHEFTEENTIVRKSVRGTPRRVCRTCERMRTSRQAK